jgi:hypothetical protein
MPELSLSYYISISKGNAELLKTFKQLLLEDFKLMDGTFFFAAEENDFSVMRKELHKMYPLVYNLNFFQMLDLIEKYRQCNPDEFIKLHTELKTCMTKIYELLNSD